MFHPLGEDLSQLKDAEVEAKLHELTKKYFQAQRLGNHQLLTQLSTFVNIYKDEMTIRYSRAAKASQSSYDGDLDQLINVD
jgi:ribosomal protein L29